MATASTMSLLPISHLKQMQQQRRTRLAGALPGKVLVLGRRRRHVVPVRRITSAYRLLLSLYLLPVT